MSAALPSTDDPTFDDLARSARRLHSAERLAQVGSWELDLASGEIDVSAGFRRLVGVGPDHPVDIAMLVDLVAEGDRPRCWALLDAVAAGGEPGEEEFRVRTVDGRTRTFHVRVEIDRPSGIFRGATIDVTDLREAQRAERESEQLFTQGFEASPIGMALTDPHTGRYLRVNRAMCGMLGRSRERLMTTTYADVTEPADVEVERAARAAMLRGELPIFQRDKRYRDADGRVTWGALTVGPVHGIDGEVRAFFSQVIDITVRKQREDRLDRDVADAAWLVRIRDALEHDDFVLYAQPIVDLSTGETIQRELLIRMRDTDGSMIAPDAFLPAAERYGLIPAIDRWVVRRAARLAAEGSAVEINLSAASLADRATIGAIEDALRETGVDPALLVFEVTETALASNLDDARCFAERLAALGCRFALDDFGTGYGTFTYLKHLPVHFVKIDIEFVRDLIRSPADERVVRTIVSLAGEFGLATVAEGIEDEETLQRLRELGVDQGQGYLLGRPVPLD